MSRYLELLFYFLVFFFFLLLLFQLPGIIKYLSANLFKRDIFPELAGMCFLCPGL